jgi:hypothetical protein
MKPLSYSEHPYFPLLVVWRIVLLSLAVLSAIEEDFQAMLLSMSVLGVLLLAGELFYKGKVNAENERRRQAFELELKERRAEEARLRLEAAQAQQLENEQSGNPAPDGEAAEASAPVVQGGFVGAMSAEQIDKELMEAEVLAKYSRS